MCYEALWKRGVPQAEGYVQAGATTPKGHGSSVWFKKANSKCLAVHGNEERQGGQMPYQEDPSNTGVGVKQLAFEGGAESSVGTEWSCWKEAAKPPFADGLGVSRKLGKCYKCLQGSTLAKRRGGLAGCAVPIPGCAVPTVFASPMGREHHRDPFGFTLGFCNKVCKKLHLLSTQPRETYGLISLSGMS